jgi:adenylate cyclase
VRRKLAVILAADVAGYSRLVAEDEEDTLRRLTAAMALFREVIERFEGRIFNTAGDAVLAEFSSAVNAVRCAIEVQESLKVRNADLPPARQMSFRIGLTVGDVVEEEGNLLGDGVNIAARLESIAPVGGLAVSRSVYDAVTQKIRLPFVDLGDQFLKNMPEPVRAYALTIGAKPADGGKASSQNLATKPATFPLALPRGLLIGAGAAMSLVLVAGTVWLFGNRPTVPATPPAPSASVEVAKVAPVTAVAPAVPAIPAAPALPEKSPAEIPKAVPPADDPAAAAKPPAPVASEIRQAAPAIPPPPPQAASAPAPSPPQPPQPSPEARMKAEADLEACRRAAPAVALRLCAAVIADNALDPARMSDAYTALGKAHRESDQPDQAIAAYTQAINLRPSADAYLNRGIVHFDLRAFESAIADFTQAIALAPNNGEAHNNKAWTLFKMGNAQAALADSDKAVLVLSTEAYVWDTRGHIHEALGNRDAAIRDYRQAVALDPAHQSSRDGLKRLGATP